MWYRRKVIAGEKLGRKIGFPTLNFHVGAFGEKNEFGVYAAEVKVAGKAYQGALYFGPKGEGKIVLEVFLFDFSDQIYGEFVSFKLGKKVRGPKKFSSVEEMKGQITRDIKAVEKSLYKRRLFF